MFLQLHNNAPSRSPQTRKASSLESLCERTVDQQNSAPPGVLRWIKKLGQGLCIKPEPDGQVIVMELDEMWHYLKKIQQTLDMESL